MEIEILDYSWTGHASQYRRPLIHSIAQICRRDRKVHDFYIGIASGADMNLALRRRLDPGKRSWGVSAIWMLYSSSSARSVRWLETELVDHFRHDPRLRNKMRGGGGRRGAGPRHYLYLAQRRSSSALPVARQLEREGVL